MSTIFSHPFTYAIALTMRFAKKPMGSPIQKSWKSDVLKIVSSE
ncbi:MAG: hypothetical protein QW738_09650 [Nitrososphaeria archaeon]